MPHYSTKFAAPKVIGCIIFLLLIIVPQGLPAKDVSVTIYAGAGQPQKLDGPQTAAGFHTPYGLALSETGVLYVADSYNNAVRVIANGEAAKALFNKPRALAIDAQHNIYVADTGNNVIRKITDGKVTTFAGNGKAGYKDGTSKEAQFNAPSSLVIDKNGYIYVADTLNHVIRKISPSGFVSTFAGTTAGNAGFRDGPAGEALFNEPAALALDSQENLYIADSGNQRIRKVSGWNVVTVAGSVDAMIFGTTYYQGGYHDGQAQEAAFNFPKGLTVLDNGTVIIADTWNSRIRAFLPNGQVVTLVGTGVNGKLPGSVDEAMLSRPVGLAYYNHTLYISDADNHLVWQMNLNPEDLQARSNFAEPAEQIQLWVNGRRLVDRRHNYYI